MKQFYQRQQLTYIFLRNMYPGYTRSIVQVKSSHSPDNNSPVIVTPCWLLVLLPTTTEMLLIRLFYPSGGAFAVDWMIHLQSFDHSTGLWVTMLRNLNSPVAFTLCDCTKLVKQRVSPTNWAFDDLCSRFARVILTIKVVFHVFLDKKSPILKTLLKYLWFWTATRFLSTTPTFYTFTTDKNRFSRLHCG